MQTLTERMKTGEEKAFRDCFNLYSPHLFWFIYKRVRNKADAEDLMMVTFEKAFAGIGAYKPVYKFSTWLCKIAKNTIIDFYKDKNKCPECTDDISNVCYYSNPEMQCIISEQYSRLLASINNLCPCLRKPINLYIAGFHYKEIADILNISMAATGNYIHKAKHQLRQMV